MRRALILEVITFAILIGIATVLVWQIGANRQRAREGQEAHAALCVFKADLGRRIISSERFMESHPNGIDGISATDLRTSQAVRISTFASLGSLVCPSDEQKGKT